MKDVSRISVLKRAEMDVLAEHADLSAYDAALLRDYFRDAPQRIDDVHGIICADIRAALQIGDLAHAGELLNAFIAFLKAHPEAGSGDPKTVNDAPK